jgi:hypothetical protein
VEVALGLILQLYTQRTGAIRGFRELAF